MTFRSRRCVSAHRSPGERVTRMGEFAVPSSSGCGHYSLSVRLLVLRMVGLGDPERTVRRHLITEGQEVTGRASARGL